MKIFKRILRAVSLVVLMVGLVVWIQDAVAKPNLEGFDPQEMGRLEASMWRSYYDGHWLRLAGLIMEGGCGQLGYSWWDATWLSLHGGRAALFFRDKTDDPRCEPELEQFFAIIRKSADRDFDIRKAAALELGWWKARRQGVAPKDYALMIAQQGTLFSGASEEALLPASRIRTEAMAYLETRPGGKMTEADWQEIAQKLNLAYLGMREAAAQAQ